MSVRARCPHCGEPIELRAWSVAERVADLVDVVTQIATEADRPLSGRRIAQLAHRRQVDVRAALARAEAAGAVRRDADGRWIA